MRPGLTVLDVPGGTSDPTRLISRRIGLRGKVVPTAPPLRAVARARSGLWPGFGKVLAGDDAPYRNLVGSIKPHPDQETFQRMLDPAGFEPLRYRNLLGGIGALHVGFKC